MPTSEWRCPVCSFDIDDAKADERPLPGKIYRCYRCLLELQFSVSASSLTVAPFDGAKEPVSTEPRRI
jgi:hypothetical protein